MDRDPGEFLAQHPPKPVADMSDTEFDAWIATIPPPPGIRDIDDPDTEDYERAMADLAAGRVYPHALVSRWLNTWGQPDRKPFKEWLADQDG